MSEEGIDSPVTHEKIEHPDSSREISCVAAEKSVSPSHGRNIRTFHHNRASTGSFNAGNGATRSRYLRASTGSCHDFCKYGMKHSSEEKARIPLRKRHAKPLPVELNPVRTRVSDERKNVKVFSRKPPSDTKSCSPKSKTALDKKMAVKHNDSIDSRSYQQKPKTILNAKTSSTSSSRQNKNPFLKNKPSAKKFSSPDPPEMIKSVCFPSENVEAEGVWGSLTASEMPGSGKRTIYSSSQRSSARSNPVKVKPALSSERSRCATGPARPGPAWDRHSNSWSPKHSPVKTASNGSRNSKLVSSPKVENRVGGDNGYPSNGEKVFEKTLHVIETEAKNCPDSRPESSFLLSREEENKEIESLEIGYMLHFPDDHAISSIPSSPKSLSYTESLLSHEEDNEEIEDRDKCIPNNESQEIPDILSGPVHCSVSSFSSPLLAQSLSSSSPPHEEDNKDITYCDGDFVPDIDDSCHEEDTQDIDYPDDELHEYISENDEIGDTQENEEIEYSNGELDKFIDKSISNITLLPEKTEIHKKTLRKKTGIAISQDNCCSPMKLKFKQGRILDLQLDNNGPRRLRFRRGRDVGAELRKGESRTLKKSEANCTVTTEEISSEKVILKHQDIQDKKDGQVLFNNMIEETASKLVESRKSKVKALVGAFETVISLQEKCHELSPSRE